MALKVQPNPGHAALARLAKKKDNFLCLTQNVDGDRFCPGARIWATNLKSPC